MEEKLENDGYHYFPPIPATFSKAFPSKVNILSDEKTFCWSNPKAFQYQQNS